MICWRASSQATSLLKSTPLLLRLEVESADFLSDWFRLETLDDSLQPTIDMLLNLAIFMWFGAVCPWQQFAHNDIIPIYRLIALGILILLFRRLPFIFLVHKFIPQIEELTHAAFVGFFGPIGVGAIFYLSVSRQFLLEEITVDGAPRPDAVKVANVTYIVVWFLVICSIVRKSRHPPCIFTFINVEKVSLLLTLRSLDIDYPWPQHSRG